METSDIISPRKIRERILADHESLRKMIAELKQSIMSSESTGDISIKSKTLDLLRFLRSHMHLEDEILYPYLKTVDSWGHIRAEEFRNGHLAQEKSMTLLENNLLDHNMRADQVFRGIQEFLDWLLADMIEEEKDFVNEQILKNDLINVDFIG